MTRVEWSTESRDDLEAIRAFISRSAPRTAEAYIERLIESVDAIANFPLSGGIVREVSRPDIREIIRGNYRIIYLVGDDFVRILTIFHGARRLDQDAFS